MTEAEWLACTESKPMYDFLRGCASERKLKLFAAASFRRLVHLLPDSRQQLGIEMLEQRADDGSPALGFRRTSVTQGVRHALPPDNFGSTGDDPYFVALMLYRELVSSSTACHAVEAANGLANKVTEQKEQADLLRDIFGNPFRPVNVKPNWLTPIVVALAQAIYDERAFDRLPELADDLVKAGCDNQDILNHCRSVGPHVRGCWVVDLMLGKE